MLRLTSPGQERWPRSPSSPISEGALRFRSCLSISSLVGQIILQGKHMARPNAESIVREAAEILRFRGIMPGGRDSGKGGEHEADVVDSFLYFSAVQSAQHPVPWSSYELAP